MDRIEQERRLYDGQRLALMKVTGNPDYLGWVTIRKKIPSPFPPFTPEEDLEAYQSWQQWYDKMKQTPYIVSIIELNRDVYESGEDEKEDDFRLRDVYFFATLDEVGHFLEERGYRLEDAVRGLDLEKPPP